MPNPIGQLGRSDRIRCLNWHGGQGSALYQAGSSGILTDQAFVDRLVEELRDCLASASQTGEDLEELESLVEFLTVE